MTHIEEAHTGSVINRFLKRSKTNFANLSISFMTINSIFFRKISLGMLSYMFVFYRQR